MQQSNPDLVPDELSAADVFDIDSSLIATDAPTTDKEILESVQLEDEEMDEDDGIEIFDEPVAKPTSIEVGNTRKRYKTCTFSTKMGMRYEFFCSNLNHCMSVTH